MQQLKYLIELMNEKKITDPCEYFFSSLGTLDEENSLGNSIT